LASGALVLFALLDVIYKAALTIGINEIAIITIIDECMLAVLSLEVLGLPKTPNI
jgi:hypothetical protein